MTKIRKTTARSPQPARSDELLRQLENAEEALQTWIASSPANARFFRQDPIAAMRAAGLNIDDDILLELELITSAIARKLG